MKLVNPKNPATTSATPGATIASQLRRRRSSGAPLARFDPLPLAANSADFEFHTVALPQTAPCPEDRLDLDIGRWKSEAVSLRGMPAQQ